MHANESNNDTKLNDTDLEDLVSIVIVNFNSGDQLVNCVNSILVNSKSVIEKIIIVDNSSKDNSHINAVFEGSLITQINNDQNLGFARACNQGAAECSSEFILFLNPDTLIRNSCIKMTTEFMVNASPSVGVCGIKTTDLDGKPHRDCARFPSLKHFIYKSVGLAQAFPKLFEPVTLAEFNHIESRYVDHVIGAYYFVRNADFKKLGGFDERFFVYLEDLDFSLRMKQIGKHVYYLAETEVFHQRHGTSDDLLDQRISFSLHSRILYAKKWFSSCSYGLVLLFTLLVEPLIRICITLVLEPRGLSSLLKNYIILFKKLSVTKQPKSLP